MKLDNDLFYYDNQLHNLDLSIRLLDPENSINQRDTHAEEQGYPIRDGNPLVCRGIIQEDSYGYSINNEWGSQGSVIDSIINWVGSTLTSTGMSTIADSLDSLTSGFKKDSFLGKANDFIHTGKEYTNMHLYSKSELLKKFGGTKVDLKGADKLTIQLISDKDGNDVFSQLDRIQRYSIGPEVETDTIAGLDTYLGIQRPPNNYMWELANFGKNKRVNKTLTLFIGNFMIVENLLIKGLDVDFSARTVMKAPNNSAESDGTQDKNGVVQIDTVTINGDRRQRQIDSWNKVSNDPNKKFLNGIATSIPLFATITITFEFAKLVTKFDLEKMLVGVKGCDYVNYVNKIQKHEF